VFNQRVRRTGSSVGTSTFIRSTAIIGAIGILGGLLMAAPVAASAATATHATWAQGRFLSGSLAGLDLAKIASLTPATARNNGAQAAQEVVDPLAVSRLGSAPINLGAVRVSPDSVVDTRTTGGALSQYARAEKTGTALGASGTVGKGGAIGPNASNPNGALSLSFDSLIGSSFASVLADLKLEIRAIAAQAKGTLQSVSGDYYIDGLTLTFTSPALAGLSSTITKAVAAADSKLDSLTGKNGELAVALRGILTAVNPALDLVGDANVSVTLSHDLRAVVADLLTATWGGSGVSFNVTTGKVSVDLGKLVGGNLNNRPVNSEILTGATVTKIVSTIASNVSTLTDQVLSRLEAALGNLKLDVDADLSLLTDQAPVVGEVCQWQDGDGNILTELLGKLLGKLVCTPTTTLLPKLETSVSVDVHGTVAQVLNGQAPASATAKVLGVPVTISTGRILEGLGLTLGNRILGTGGILSVLKGALDGPLLAQANAGLLGSTSIRTVLSDILSVRVNLQETTLGGGGMAVAANSVFTQTALRVAVVRGAGSGGLTTLSIAAASVAPMVTTAGPGDPGNPGDPGDPGTDNPGDPGNPGGPGTGDDADPGTPTATGPDGLAYTGVAVGAIIAALLGLLTAGAWLVREGYRRTHPPLEP
jgi:hypothetical protein